MSTATSTTANRGSINTNNRKHQKYHCTDSWLTTTTITTTITVNWKRCSHGDCRRRAEDFAKFWRFTFIDFFAYSTATEWLWGWTWTWWRQFRWWWQWVLQSLYKVKKASKSFRKLISGPRKCQKVSRKLHSWSRKLHSWPRNRGKGSLKRRSGPESVTFYLCYTRIFTFSFSFYLFLSYYFQWLINTNLHRFWLSLNLI